MKAALQHRPKVSRSLLGLASLAAVASLSATFVQPANAANVTCQAINATGVITGAIPTSNCSSVATGDTFEIDLSAIFAANMGMLDVSKFYSL
jgi:hypothetical protein